MGAGDRGGRDGLRRQAQQLTGANYLRIYARVGGEELRVGRSVAARDAKKGFAGCYAVGAGSWGCRRRPELRGPNPRGSHPRQRPPSCLQGQGRQAAGRRVRNLRRLRAPRAVSAVCARCSARGTGARRWRRGAVRVPPTAWCRRLPGRLLVPAREAAGRERRTPPSATRARQEPQRPAIASWHQLPAERVSPCRSGAARPQTGDEARRTAASAGKPGS